MFVITIADTYVVVNVAITYLKKQRNIWD